VRSRLQPGVWRDARWRWRALARPRDAVAHLLLWGAALAVAGLFLWIVGDVVARGAGHVSPTLLTAAPADAGRAGGIAPILVSTALLVGICMAVSLPLGLGSAVLLAEFSRRGTGYGRAVRRSLDVLAGMPSIVFGLFGYAFFCRTLGLGFSLLAGGLTLACMVLPFLIRSVEAGLRGVPDEIRAGAAALGLSRATTVRSLLLPAAAPGVAVGVILGIGRALAETAALIFTSGYVDRMPGSLLDSGRALSVHIFDLTMNVPGGDGMAYTSALVLLALLLGINAAATWAVQRWQGLQGMEPS